MYNYNEILIDNQTSPLSRRVLGMSIINLTIILFLKEQNNQAIL